MNTIFPEVVPTEVVFTKVIFPDLSAEKNKYLQECIEDLENIFLSKNKVPPKLTTENSKYLRECADSFETIFKSLMEDYKKDFHTQLKDYMKFDRELRKLRYGIL